MTALDLCAGFQQHCAGDQEHAAVPCHRHDAHVSIIRATGDLRAPVSLDLRHLLVASIQKGEVRAVLDLSGLNAIDAAGIGELVALLNIMTSAGGVLQIVHAKGYVRRLLQMAALWPLPTGQRATLDEDLHQQFVILNAVDDDLA